MSEEHAPENLMLSVAQAIIIFGPSADSSKEYKAYDIAKHLNPNFVSRTQPLVVNESNLEVGFGESTIRNSLKKKFPLTLEFKRHNEGIGQSKKYFYKIKYLSYLNDAGFTVETLASAIMSNIEEERSRKRKRLEFSTVVLPPAPAPAFTAHQPMPQPLQPPLLPLPPPPHTPTAPLPPPLPLPQGSKRGRKALLSIGELSRKVHNLQRKNSILLCNNSELKRKLKLL